MNHRQRFYATMHYQPRDRSPIIDFGFWEETIPLWHKQGLPEEVFFTYDDFNTDLALHGLLPGYRRRCHRCQRRIVP